VNEYNKVRKKVEKEMKDHATFGQLSHDGIITGAWFITLIDAVDVAARLIMEDHKK
jgi:hypothetical protein